ncbi:MAG: polysaccharide biosynthesis protein [Micrococcales bacterium]|nr:polysaccharide biosynthesis protein [Micrococcales bacterium]
MIPHKIHYCWLSEDPLPPDIQKCLDTWQEVLPDYEVIRWDTRRFDVHSVPFVREAVSVRKWAFAADYIRAFAVHEEGGIYLDSDVVVRKRFDDFLGYDFFTSVEYHRNIVEREDLTLHLHDDGTRRDRQVSVPGIGIQAAIFGARAGNAFLKDCLDHYRDRHFLLPDGGLDTSVIAPSIYAAAAEKYGFIYRDELQSLQDDMMVFPSEVFAGHPDQETARSVAVHRGVGSWRDRRPVSIRARLRRIPGKLRRATGGRVADD